MISEIIFLTFLSAGIIFTQFKDSRAQNDDYVRHIHANRKKFPINLESTGNHFTFSKRYRGRKIR